MISSELQTFEAQRFISNLLTKSRRNKTATILIFSLSISLLIAVFAQLFINSVEFVIVLMVTVFVLSSVIHFNQAEYKDITEESVIEHINCKFSEFEESCQLIKRHQTGSILQQLQTEKIKLLLSQNSTQETLHKSLEGINFKPSLMVLIIIVIVAIASSLFSEFKLQSKKTTFAVNQDTSQQFQKIPQITSKQITVNPPQYTDLSSSKTTAMDLKIVEGSIVSWELNFSKNDLQYFMVGTEGNKRPFRQIAEQGFLYSSSFTQTSLYRIVYEAQGKFVTVGDIYTIEVIADQRPVVKIIEPKVSLVEIPKDADANFDLAVEIKDDYGISSISIIASVASGSGEAVKFRDVEFAFDNFVIEGSRKIYYKHWVLSELKMEPGDEVYLKVLVEDNKQPEPQLVKSSSVIVRWLDEEQVEISAAGIRISFVPEYFRSQRQIIIETEQLISDRKGLDPPRFDLLSTDLGHSQSDLKTKYGLYLGDEIGEGPAEQFGLAEDTHIEHKSSSDSTVAEVGDKKNQQSEEQHLDEEPEVGHFHEEMVDVNDRSGRSELIARFAHNHGGTEIGPISKTDPKSWMKKAVKEMWQAELHLMLSQPELALEFENKAYDYLKLAMQAERIYVKRLGFEPPPVNEDSRLTGELKDILSYSISAQDNPDEDQDRILFEQVFSFLFENQNRLLNQQQITTLQQLKDRILILSKTRPALIKHAATIERIVIGKSLILEHCKDCIKRLKQKLWQLMPAAVSQPKLRQSLSKTFVTDNQYQQQILLLKKSKLFDGTRND